MALTQMQLDALLDQRYRLSVEEWPAAPVGKKKVYAPVRSLIKAGEIRFTARSLLHAIGTKSVPLSIGREEALRSAHRYFHILDWPSGQLRFVPSKDSDNRTNESREVGVGVMCIVARRCWRVPWDSLETIQGQGKRFDFRASWNGKASIFEAKGSVYSSNQTKQIKHGLEKKKAHRARGDTHDVELVVSTLIGTSAQSPKLVLADPETERDEEMFGERAAKVYRLRHWARLLRFAGAPATAQRVYGTALRMSRGADAPSAPRQVEDPDWTTVRAGNRTFVGRWTTSWVPPSTGRYQRLARLEDRGVAESWLQTPVSVFQGLEERAALAIVAGFDPAAPLENDPGSFTSDDNVKFSVFADRSVLAFRVE